MNIRGFLKLVLCVGFLTGCGGSSKGAGPAAAGNSAAGDSGGETTSAGTTSRGGTTGGGTTGSGGAAAQGGGFDPTQPIDPSRFSPDPQGTPPRTSGPRAEPLPRPSCPEEAPTVGDACDLTEMLCSYGDSLAPNCRAIFRCSAGAWTKNSRLCVQPPADFCPAEQPELGVACTPPPDSEPFRPDAVCAYGSLSCFCPSCERNSTCPFGQVWTCISPPADFDCPEIAPNIGEGCEVQAKRCAYGDPCSAGTVLFCRHGAWEYEGAECGE